MLGPAEVAHGPMFIGFMFNVLLYGIMITQVYLYFAAYKQDKLVVKLFVLLLFLCDTVNTAFDFVYLYDCFVVHFSEVAYLTKATWVFSTDPAMTGITAGLVQLFFAWRVLVLTSNVCLCGIVVLLALLGTAGGIATAAECGIISQFVQFQRFQRRQKTGFKRSDDVVDKIIRITVQTGLITSICALVDLITYLSSPTGIHLIFNLPLAKLYTNSLMSSLNSRESRQEPTASAPNTHSSANTTAYKHTQYSFTWPSQEEDHNASALNSRRFLDVTVHSGGNLSPCLSTEMLHRDSGSTSVRNIGSSGTVSGTTPDFGIRNPV